MALRVIGGGLSMVWAAYLVTALAMAWAISMRFRQAVEALRT